MSIETEKYIVESVESAMYSMFASLKESGVYPFVFANGNSSVSVTEEQFKYELESFKGLLAAASRYKYWLEESQ